MRRAQKLKSSFWIDCEQRTLCLLLRCVNQGYCTMLQYFPPIPFVFVINSALERRTYMTEQSERNWEAYQGTGLIAFNEQDMALALRQAIGESTVFAVVLLSSGYDDAEILEIDELEGVTQEEARQAYMAMVTEGGFAFAAFT